MFNWLREYKFKAHLTAFLLMVFTSIGMIVALKNDAPAFIWVLVAVFAAANILAILIK